MVSFLSIKEKIKLNSINALAHFNNILTQKILYRLLKSKHEKIRQAALDTLFKMKIAVQVSQLTPHLKTHNLAFQLKIIDKIITLNHPDTIHHLIDPLTNNSEYIQRAAVEIINSIGNSRSIKELLNETKNDNKSSLITYALAENGGPRIIYSSIELINSKDLFIKNSAIKILNNTTDKEAITILLSTLGDPNESIRKCAINAITHGNHPNATPHLLKILKKRPDLVPIIIPAITSLQDSRAVPEMINKSHHPEPSIQILAFFALAEITNENQVKKVIKETALHTQYKTLKTQHALNNMLIRLRARFPIEMEYIENKQEIKKKKTTVSPPTSLKQITIPLKKYSPPNPKNTINPIDLIFDGLTITQYAAIQLMKNKKNEIALKIIMDALKDQNKWMRDDAINTIILLSHHNLIPYSYLLHTLENVPDAALAIIPTLATLGGHMAVPIIIQQLKRPESLIKIEALNALAEITNQDQLKHVIQETTPYALRGILEVQFAANEMLKRLKVRFPKKQ